MLSLWVQAEQFQAFPLYFTFRWCQHLDHVLSSNGTLHQQQLVLLWKEHNYGEGLIKTNANLNDQLMRFPLKGTKYLLKRLLMREAITISLLAGKNRINWYWLEFRHFTNPHYFKSRGEAEPDQVVSIHFTFSRERPFKRIKKECANGIAIFPSAIAPFIFKAYLTVSTANCPP